MKAAEVRLGYEWTLRMCSLPLGVTITTMLPNGDYVAWAKHSRRNNEAVQQRDEADEAKHIGASQLIPGVRRTSLAGGATEPATESPAPAMLLTSAGQLHRASDRMAMLAILHISS